MRTKAFIPRASKMIHVACAIVLTCVLGASLTAAAQAKPVSPVPQRGFDTPQAAAEALVQAADVYDQAVLKEILGPGSEDLIASKDSVQDKNRAALFAAKAKEKKSVELSA